MGGLQANSGGVSRAWPLPAAQVRVRPQRGERPRRAIPDCSKNRRPEAAIVSYLLTLRGESRLGARSLSSWHASTRDNRIAGGRFRSPACPSQFRRIFLRYADPNDIDF